MNALVLIPKDDPAELIYPATFPIEVALRTASIQDICKSYNITKDEWDVLRYDPRFIAELTLAADMLKKEGMSFRMKARLQSEELLKTSWKIIHAPGDTVPANVRADLIKFTIKAAGLDGSRDQGQAAPGSGLNIQINLG